MTRSLWHRLAQIFFAHIDARGFGLMRVAWGAVVFVFMLMDIQDVTFLYSGEGIVPLQHLSLIARGAYRLSLLDWVNAPSAVFVLYVILLLASLLAMLGIWPRLTVTITTLLLFSFHERNTLHLGGGDAVLRLTGFILMISPNIDAISLRRLRLQWIHWKKTGSFLAYQTMPAWPRILLLWQLIVLYAASGWFKLLGKAWLNGTAVGIVLHHEHIRRVPPFISHLLSTGSGIATYATLVFEFLWPFLLIAPLVRKILPRFPTVLRRTLLLGGLLFHGLIFVLLDVGAFSPAILAAYLGILTASDLDALKKWRNRGWKQSIAVLYDGACGLCRRSIFLLQMFDPLRRLLPVDFRNEEMRKKVAPDLREEDLDRAMHIRFLPKEPFHHTDVTEEAHSHDTLKGFAALRKIARHLPPLWPLYPLLFLPGAESIGDRIYARIAAARKKCSHESCKL